MDKKAEILEQKGVQQALGKVRRLVGEAVATTIEWAVMAEANLYILATSFITTASQLSEKAYSTGKGEKPKEEAGINERVIALLDLGTELAVSVDEGDEEGARARKRLNYLERAFLRLPFGAEGKRHCEGVRLWIIEEHIKALGFLVDMPNIEHALDFVGLAYFDTRFSVDEWSAGMCALLSLKYKFTGGGKEVDDVIQAEAAYVAYKLPREELNRVVMETFDQLFQEEKTRDRVLKWLHLLFKKPTNDLEKRIPIPLYRTLQDVLMHNASMFSARVATEVLIEWSDDKLEVVSDFLAMGVPQEVHEDAGQRLCLARRFEELVRRMSDE